MPAQTGITEFDELNTVATDLITKVNRAYYNQRQFVENASHEIQTPLAIIRSKLELLINQSGITEKVAELLADITDANDRLSLMNRNLLLLAKIDNNQFPGKEPVNISALLHKIINNYRDYHDETIPSVTESIEEGIIVTANPSLMEVLISNLVKNAIVHNIPGGYMMAELKAGCLTIINTGPPAGVDLQLMFERFRKGSDAAKSSGLGLALASQVCQLYGFSITLQYENGLYQTRLITS
ncbi:MAG: HAMP domain-containing histidine kinase [Bacteroidetes bacterium]|nr:HAMP domain-containing histidine kinase [Bacteroidota bacterium]